MSTLPSGWIAIVYVSLFVPTVVTKPVSRVPSELIRAIYLLVVPLYAENPPQIRTFPSGCKKTLLTILFAPTVVTKPVSRVPLLCKRAIRFAVVPL